MRSLAEGLPPEVAAQVNPQWRENERAYWAVRDTLLDEYGGRWIALADGAVIASGTNPVEVFRTGQSSGRHPFIIRVGAEGEPCQMRRASFPSNRPAQPAMASALASRALAACSS
jgi:hypothetical protein